MFPYITVFGRQLGSYGLMALCGALVAGVFMCWLTRKRGLNDNETIILMLFSALGVLVGGSVLYAITNWRLAPALLAASDIKSFFRALVNLFGGSVFYGGLLGGIAAALLTMKKRRLEMAVFSDMFAVSIPLFHAFARVGCFLGGCCYGIESEWGVTVHGNPWLPEINGVSRFPVQLLEAALNLVLFSVLLWLYWRGEKRGIRMGRLIFVYLLLYAIVRFFDEFLRGDAIRGFIFGLTTSQFISCILAAVSIVCLLYTWLRQKKRC